MIGMMTCDICHKKFLVRPSKYSNGMLYDTINFSRCNTKDLNAGGDSCLLILCPEHLMEITNLIADKHGVYHLKCRAERWDSERRHNE